MSRIKVDTAVNKTATGPVDFPSGITGVAATFTGNVTVGGTITYDDVQNVDSVGVVTAGKGLRVTAEGIVVTAGMATLSGGANLGGANITFGDSGTVNDDRLVFGAGTDFSIYHDGTHNYIEGTTAADTKVIQNGNFLVQSLAGETILRGLQNAQVDLYYNNTKKIETISTGASVYGGLRLEGGGFTREHLNIVGTALNSNKVITLSD